MLSGGDVVGNAIPTGCPCGEVHPTKAEAEECRKEFQALLRWAWKRRTSDVIPPTVYGDRPEVGDMPDVVWRAGTVFLQGVARLAEGRMRQTFLERRRVKFEHAGDSYYEWRYGTNWHLVQVDFDTGDMAAEAPVCGEMGDWQEFPRGGRPICPNCFRQAEEWGISTRMGYEDGW